MDLPPISGGRATSAAPVDLEPKAGARSDEAAARQAAEAFEAAFLAEMLKHSGANRTPEALGGGAGEDAFGSLLTAEQAKLMAARGGIGLAEHIFNAIRAKDSTP
jgi:Rod binding domain-containing protein